MAATYPAQLASGVLQAGRFDQFDLFAGESDIVTSQAQAADGQALQQFQVVVYDTNGRLVPLTGTAEHSGVLATFTGQPTANDTVTINGVAITFVASGATGAQVNIGATAVATVQNLVNLINGTPDGVDINTGLPTYGTGPLAGTGVTASVDVTGLVVSFRATVAGTAGNAITITESTSNMTVASPTLTGATADKATGTLSFAAGNAINTQTVTVNGVVITFVTSGASGSQVNIGGTPTITATNLAALINSLPGTYGVTAVATGTMVVLTANAEGLAGNAVALAISNTIPAISGATLTGGGVSEPDPASGIPAGVVMQAVPAATPGIWAPIAIGGVFNHEVLIWPLGIATLAQRKRVCVGSNVMIGQLL